MKICSKCKVEIPDDSSFCPYCGTAIKNETSINNKNTLADSNASFPRTAEEKKRSTWPVVVCAVFTLMLVLAGTYWGTYSAAKQESVNREFSKASKLLLIPPLTQLHDSDLVDYIAAGKLLSEGRFKEAKSAFSPLAKKDYIDAKYLEKEASYYEAVDRLKGGNLLGYTTIVTLAKNGFSLASDGLENAKKQAFDYAVNQYHEGDVKTAEKFFNALAGYKRSSDYITLIHANNFSALKKLIGFENATDILLDKFAVQFLTGTWKTNDGKYYFSISPKDDGNQASYNLSHIELDGSYYYTIEDGIYYLHDKDSSAQEATVSNVREIIRNQLEIGNNSGKRVFRFTIINSDIIKVYCFNDGSTHTLFRQ